MNDTLRTVSIVRDSVGVYTATNASGDALTFGQGDGLFSPVELLLAALAGCAAIDVDVVTSRRAEPMSFEATASGHKVIEDGATRLADLDVAFRVRFGDDDQGRTAASMVDRLVRLSHDKDCTVSRTIEHATPVAMHAD